MFCYAVLPDMILFPKNDNQIHSKRTSSKFYLPPIFPEIKDLNVIDVYSYMGLTDIKCTNQITIYF